MTVLGKYGFQEAADFVRLRFSRSWLNRLRSNRQPKKKIQYRTRPERFRLALEELGPMFIKLGQLLSTRPDLIPEEYTVELERLQDHVPPVPGNQIIAEIEKQLGDRINNLFAEFDTEPLAAGSIAQVHKARLLDGREAAVKVLRPDIIETLQAETGILHDLAGLLRIILLDEQHINIQQMTSEFSEAIMQETELDRERKNLVRFHVNFQDDPTVHIPQVYKEYCTKSILVMEYIKGVRPGDAETMRQAGLDPLVIAKRGANFVFSQIFEHGFFHTDPHPGNLFLLSENVIAPMDFGQVARLGRGDLKLLNEMMVAIVENDAEVMLRALERNQLISENTNQPRLKSQMENMLAAYTGLPLAEVPYSEIIREIFKVIRHNHIQPPPQFTLMLKTMLTLEKLTTQMNPEFNLIEYLQPYARQYQMRSFDPRSIARNMRNAARGASDLAAKLPDDMHSILNKFRSGKFQIRIHHEHLDELSETLNRSSSRISFALIIAALLVSSSMLVPQEGMILRLISYQQLGMAGYIGAAFLGLGLVISMIRGRHV